MRCNMSQLCQAGEKMPDLIPGIMDRNSIARPRAVTRILKGGGMEFGFSTWKFFCMTMPTSPYHCTHLLNNVFNI